MTVLDMARASVLLGTFVDDVFVDCDDVARVLDHVHDTFVVHVDDVVLVGNAFNVDLDAVVDYVVNVIIVVDVDDVVENDMDVIIVVDNVDAVLREQPPLRNTFVI